MVGVEEVDKEQSQSLREPEGAWGTRDSTADEALWDSRLRC